MATVDDEVLGFVAEFRGVKCEKLNAATTLFGDLGVDGQDGWELIEAFAKRFRVDCSKFQPMRHFGPEAGPAPWTPLVWLWRWIRHWEKAPEERVGLTPIHIRDLIVAARTREWTL